MRNDSDEKGTETRLRELLRAEGGAIDEGRLDNMRRVVLAAVPEKTRVPLFSRFRSMAMATSLAAILLGIVLWRALPQGPSIPGSLKPVYTMAGDDEKLDQMILFLAEWTSTDDESGSMFDLESYGHGSDDLMIDDEWGYSFLSL